MARTSKKALRNQARILTYGGAIPFVFLAYTLASGAVWPISHDTIIHAVAQYAALIIVFIAGIHWHTHLVEGSRVPVDLLVASNIVTLLAWAGILLGSYTVALGVFAALLLWQLWIDVRLEEERMIERWFFTLRKRVTLIVVASLVVALVALVM